MKFQIIRKEYWINRCDKGSFR